MLQCVACEVVYVAGRAGELECWPGSVAGGGVGGAEQGLTVMSVSTIICTRLMLHAQWVPGPATSCCSPAPHSTTSPGNTTRSSIAWCNTQVVCNIQHEQDDGL